MQEEAKFKWIPKETHPSILDTLKYRFLRAPWKLFWIVMAPSLVFGIATNYRRLNSDSTFQNMFPKIVEDTLIYSGYFFLTILLAATIASFFIRNRNTYFYEKHVEEINGKNKVSFDYETIHHIILLDKSSVLLIFNLETSLPNKFGIYFVSMNKTVIFEFIKFINSRLVKKGTPFFLESSHTVPIDIKDRDNLLKQVGDYLNISQKT